jgi:hypothetical protein
MNIPMTYHAEFDESAFFDWPVGHFCYSPENPPTHIYLRLPMPNDESSACILPIDGSRGWQWDGNREKPTITPSIWYHTTPDWHGFVRNGELVPA